VPPERWERANKILARRWLRDVTTQGTLATGSFAGLVGIRCRLDAASLASRCECGETAPCEHALALMMHLELEKNINPLTNRTGRTDRTDAAPRAPETAGPASVPRAESPPSAPTPAPAGETPGAPPAPQAWPSGVLRLSLDPSDPGRLRLASQGAFPDAAAEALRWLWWRREGAEAMSGEARTLAQAWQLLAARGVPARAGLGAGARVGFHQRALGETIHVRLEEPGAEASLALAASLSARGAVPMPGALPAELWSLPEGAGFASWALEAARVAEVAPDLALNPKPLRGVDVLLDPGCLPARMREGGADAPVASGSLRAALVRILGGEPVVDAQNGHVLVPAARVVDVEEGLRALGADVTYRRLAPANARYLAWEPQLPEDTTGARPRLREPFRGALEGEVPGLKPDVALASYQREAVAFILRHGHTCMLADDMGLGKTLECIAAAMFLPGRVLVVCPASAREVWRREVGKFTTATAEVVTEGAADARFVITGYSNLERVLVDPAAFDLVILDESHYVKNAQSGRARLVRERLQAIPRRLVVSGTPVMNTPDEVRAQLAFLHPEEWSDGAWFHRRFEEPFEGGSPEVREAVLSRLRLFLEGVMIRREKSVAMPELPEKRVVWHRVRLPPEARRAYVALEEDFERFVQAEGASSLATAKAGGKLERLKQAALAGKLPEVVAFVRSLAAQGDKVVVFSRYRDALKSLAEALADLGPVTLHGETAPAERAEAERRFQEDPACRVFLGQIVAAGTAITLTAGTHAVFADLDWNPANHRQAMDRIHRRGQTKPCVAHFFLAEETVDEDVAHVLDAKGQMMDALLSGKASGEIRGARRQVGERLLARRSVPSSPPPA
jgi:SWI/SNF-related matrix-associated actin-dependent regulator 1 of chromatin subfamily A